MRKLSRLIAIVLVLAGGLVVVSGCGGDDSAAPDVVSVPSQFDFAGPECPWETGEGEVARLECADGVYRVTINDINVFQFKTIDLAESVTTVSVEADLSVPNDQEPGLVGLSCVAADAAGYVFLLATDGGYVIAKQTGLGQREREFLGRVDDADLIRVAPFENRVRGVCVAAGETTLLRLEINGEEALSVEDPGGFGEFSRVAFVTDAAEAGDEFAFDNVTIAEPDPSELTQERVPEPPTEDPSAAPADEEFAPPPGEPDPAQMALRPNDLSSGFVVVAEGYVDPEGSVATFEREFEVAGEDAVAVGGSRLYWVSSDPDVFASENEATVFSLGLRGVCESPEVFEELLESGAAAEGEPIQCSNVETIEIDDLGDRAIGARADFQGTPVRGITEEGTFVLLTFQVGRTVHSLWVVGEQVNNDDIIDLARIQAERAEAELAAAVSG